MVTFVSLDVPQDSGRARSDHHFRLLGRIAWGIFPVVPPESARRKCGHAVGRFRVEPVGMGVCAGSEPEGSETREGNVSRCVALHWRESYDSLLLLWPTRENILRSFGRCACPGPCRRWRRPFHCDGRGVSRSRCHPRSRPASIGRDFLRPPPAVGTETHRAATFI